MQDEHQVIPQAKPALILFHLINFIEAVEIKMSTTNIMSNFHLMIIVIFLLVNDFSFAILVGQNCSNEGSNDATTTSNLTSLTTQKAKELENNTTFYYDADAFLINKSDNGERDNTKGQVVNSTKTDSDKVSNQYLIPASPSQTSSRNGRMLDLDTLVGDFATAKANKERSQSGNRQSRLLSDIQSNLDIGAGKRLHIQGFIPIIGVKDDDADDDQAHPSATNKRPKVSQLNINQVSSSNELPHAQSSIGHATFGVQRYLNVEQQAQQQLFPSPESLGEKQQQIDAKYSGATSSVVETLKKPIKKLTSFASGSSGQNEVHTNRNNQMQQPQQNCLCVPFYTCKNGYISESSLGKTQIQQMILQQQQLSQQPRQIEPVVLDIKRGTIESVPVQQQHVQHANSYAPIDERSFDREIITTAPISIESQQFVNETVSVVTDGLMMDAMTTTTTPSMSLDSASSSNEQAGGAQNMTQFVDQNSDYSQDILGRMLGLKSNSKMSLPTGLTFNSAVTGVCGLLRTCCNIPAHLFPSQQDMAYEKLMAHYSLNNKFQMNAINPATGLTSPQAVAQGYQIPAQQQPQSPLGLPSSQITRIQSIYPAPNMIDNQNSLAHRSNQYPAQSSGRYKQPQINTNTQLSQYTRASGPVQALHSFQQQLYQPPKNWQTMPVANIGGQQQQMTQLSVSTIRDSYQINNNLGTRKILDGRCGLRQSAGITGRVQNLQYHDSSADFGEYPAQAAILKRLNGSESLFVCGGTLISQFWIATAAHCLKKHAQSDLKIRLGEWDVHRDDEFYPFVEKEVRDVVIHSEFVAGNLVNDIALLRLDSPVDQSLPHVNPACLPTIDEVFTKQRCWVTGWGKDSFGQKGSFQAVLREVELPVVGHSECESALRQTRLGIHYRLHSGFICAGGEGGKDACEGDGGSGLYCLQDGVIKVAGLVSWGIGCGQAGVPGVYVNLAYYRPWIENIISIDEDIYSKNSAPPQ